MRSIPEPELADLSVHDFGINNNVDLVYEDGSHCHYRYAFWRREGDWIVVYTEHCGYLVIWANSIETITGRERK